MATERRDDLYSVPPVMDEEFDHRRCPVFSAKELRAAGITAELGTVRKSLRPTPERRAGR